MVDSELTLSDIKAGAVVSGIVPNQDVTVYYGAGDGSTFGQEIVDVESVKHLHLARQSDRVLPFDANPENFRLVAEVLRIRFLPSMKTCCPRCRFVSCCLTILVQVRQSWPGYTSRKCSCVRLRNA
jgi:hypothetical protein